MLIEDDDVNWDEVDRVRYWMNAMVFVVGVDIAQYPLELIRTRMQFSNSRGVQPSMWAVTRNIIQLEGYKGLFRGLVTARAPSLPGSAMYFGGFEVSKELIGTAVRRYDPSLVGTPMYDLIAAGIAGTFADCASLLFYTPGDIVSQRLQVIRDASAAGRVPPQQTSMEIIKHIYRQNGIRGFYRGLVPSMLTYGPYSGIWFSGYEVSKHAMNRVITDKYNADHNISDAYLHRQAEKALDAQQDHHTSYTAVHLLAGGVAGFLATVLTNPMDVLRTRVQIPESNPLQHGYFKLFAEIVRNEGIKSLWKGTGPSLTIAIPGSALTFAGYELCKRFSLKDLPRPSQSDGDSIPPELVNSSHQK